ncbi:hypothetical protein SAMD00023353_0301380 [Rosellinia necatrix]|uniref:Uncharacterized protein n=1 Tax=Rosellinia necatrix TaxID=77044 RepID=A0A1W2TAL6_ROSNE|nr:hypothetical protein SAMD00023353_0301380 [Rosellinia necatrix]
MMYRSVLASLALVALVQAAPITEATKTTGNSVGDATDGGIIIPKPTFILFPPVTGPIKPSDKRDTEVKERQFSWGDPTTGWNPPATGGGDTTIGTPIGGGLNPPATGGGDTTIGTPIGGGLNPSNKRQTIISGSDPIKAKIIALELEYETLLQAFGTKGPKPIQNRLKAIKEELLKYGITIIQSPDGTTTTFTPGKRDFTFPVGSLPGGPLIPENPIPGGPLEPST